jgi:hypothetical protein
MMAIMHPHHLVDELLDVPEGVLAREWRGQAIGDGVHLLQVDARPLLEAPAHRVRPLRLDSHHANR